MTLRFRLTFWNTVMLALVLAIFALAFHTFVANTLYNQLEATIRSQAEQVVQIFQSGIDPSRARLPRTIILSSQVLAQTTTVTGEITDSSPNTMGLPVPLPVSALELNLAGEATQYDATFEDQPIRVFSAPVRSPTGQVTRTVQIAQSLRPIIETLKIIRLALLVGGGLALLMAAVGGALISGRALQPLRHFTETANHIVTAQDLQERLVPPSKPVPGTTCDEAAGDVWYTVQRGDTLSGIAAVYGTTVQAIMEKNGLSNPNMIYVGQTLCIPGQAAAVPYVESATAAAPAAPAVVVQPSPATPAAPADAVPATAATSYRVQRGDTLSGIAAQHGTTVSALTQLNNIANPNAIYVGQSLALP